MTSLDEPELASAPAYSTEAAVASWSQSEVAEQILLARPELWETHPVTRWGTDLILATPSLNEIAAAISTAVMNGHSGRGFRADPRHGKSTAIFYFAQCIRHEPTFRHVGLISLDAMFGGRGNETAFYQKLLHSAGFGLKPARRPFDAFVQVVNAIASLVRDTSERRVVLFIDEAQAFTEREWDWLKGVQNALRQQAFSICLVVIPFGSPQLVHMMNTLNSAGRDDLTKRFLRRLVGFHGVRNADELRQVLEQMDKQRYPVDRGWSLSQFFFPRGWSGGWRLALEAPTFWGALTGTEDPGRSVVGCDVGMETIAMAIQSFHVEFHQSDSAVFRGTHKQWSEAVRAADLRDEVDKDSDCSGRDS